MNSDLINKINNNPELNGMNFKPTSIKYQENLNVLEKAISEIHKKKPINNILEIGTYQGMSSCWFSTFCKHIDTIDIDDHKIKYKLWDAMNIRNKIDFHLIKSDAGKKELINSLDFDFAFVDGDHEEGVNLDFELVRKCGRVLFHDYNKENAYLLEHFKHIIKLVDSLPESEVVVYNEYAYWSVN